MTPGRDASTPLSRIRSPWCGHVCQPARMRVRTNIATGKVRVFGALIAGIGLVSNILVAPAANATATGTVQTALAATMSRANDRGLDVISIVRSSKEHTIPGTTIEIPERTSIRHHVELDTEGSSYYSLRTRSSGQLLGMQGRDGSVPYSTLSMRAIGLAPEWPQTFASSRGLPLNTVIRDITERMGYYEQDDDQVLISAKRLIAPPTSWDGVEDFWRNVRVRRASGGRTIVTARSSAGGTDCTYPYISLTIRTGVVVQSAWKSVCPDSGTTTYTTKVRYEDNIGSVPTDAISQDAAFARAVPGQNPGWPALAAAANSTAATSFRSITEVNSANVASDLPSAARGLRYLDAVMMAGNPGVIVVPAIARVDDPGWTQYVVLPNANSAYLAAEFTRNITGLTVDVAGNGTIDKITTEFSNSPRTTTTTFAR